jgi:predicted glycosyltransferase
MKIAYYCQHVLGIGHVHRSLEICRACSRAHQVTMIVGGPALALSGEPFAVLQLPGLMMDQSFSQLQTCDPGLSIEEVQEARTRQLQSFIKTVQPERLIVELYPFGRKAFRFELDPLLDTARRSATTILCSLRDILVEKKEGQQRHERRAADILNKYFDAVLVHADPRLVSLQETFSLIDQVHIPIHYTGFISPEPAPGARQRVRREIGLSDEQKLIVASIGSGSVGGELLEAVVNGLELLEAEPAWQARLFSGPYCPPEIVSRLEARQNKRVHVSRFSKRFVDWLAAADLSISMAGYNTCMNTLAAGVPALMLPFEENFEQRRRVEKLIQRVPIGLLDHEALAADRLAPAIRRQLMLPRFSTDIDLNGAAGTLAYIETLSPNPKP